MATKFLQSDPHTHGNWIYNNSGTDYRTVGRMECGWKNTTRHPRDMDKTKRSNLCVIGRKDKQYLEFSKMK